MWDDGRVTRRGPASDAELDALRATLARHGVTLFAPPAPTEPWPPEPAEVAEVVAALVESGDSRLRGSVPCLLVTVPPSVAREAVERAATLHPERRADLGFLYRLARALAISRRPDLERLLGRAPVLPPSSIEPGDLPAPEEQHGEMTPWSASERARERREPDVAGGVERLFDTWLRLYAVERQHDRA